MKEKSKQKYGSGILYMPDGLLHATNQLGDSVEEPEELVEQSEEEFLEELIEAMSKPLPSDYEASPWVCGLHVVVPNEEDRA